MTTKAAWQPGYTARAQEIWSEYQRTHDVSDQVGQSAGIDPVSGRIWFGTSIEAVVDAMNADGVDRPLFFVRVGYDTYFRKDPVEGVLR